ncbi:hypothetical protein [Motiliproteus sediminis]|uniref:hypothetical protein n=1 Tax=Motiliproteus sediminis TaxID=1468178 RepID=UPI001AEFDD41|nr:hypothetical protein [Motiliproteus sediminis]
MNSPLWFIDLLREHPLAGFAIGLLFAALMFGSKNLVIYLYDRHRQGRRQPPPTQRP